MAGFLTTFLIGVSFLIGVAVQIALGARHPIVAQLASLLVAVAIGLLIVRLRRPRVAANMDPWQRHCAAHERATRGSTMMTAPGLRVDFDWAKPSSQIVVPFLTDFIQPNKRSKP